MSNKKDPNRRTNWDRKYSAGRGRYLLNKNGMPMDRNGRNPLKNS